MPPKVLQARQSVKLTGLGVDKFDAYIRGIMEICEVLSMHVPANAMQPYTPAIENGNLVLEFGNRYLSIGQDAQDEEIDLAAIDPLRLLRNRMPPGARHVDDNQVLYYEMRTQTTGG